MGRWQRRKPYHDFNGASGMVRIMASTHRFASNMLWVMASITTSFHLSIMGATGNDMPSRLQPVYISQSVQDQLKMVSTNHYFRKSSFPQDNPHGCAIGSLGPPSGGGSSASKNRPAPGSSWNQSLASERSAWLMWAASVMCSARDGYRCPCLSQATK